MDAMGIFDNLITRKDTNSLKWDNAHLHGGSNSAIPMWVADMDFPVAKAIQEALLKRIEHPIYGYTPRSAEVTEALISWLSRRHSLQTHEEWLLALPGVTPGLCLFIQAFTSPGDGIVIQTPVYYPFSSSIVVNNRKLLLNPLIEEEGRFVIDYSGLEALFREGARAFLFCSPHNPAGRVWSRAELIRLGRLCSKYDVMVFADEIHCDLVMPGHKHTPLVSLTEETGVGVVMAISTSKTFNLPGIPCATAIMPDPEVREKLEQTIKSSGFGDDTNLMGNTTALAAYRFGEAWLEEAIGTIHKNYLLLDDFIQKEMTSIRLLKLEGTYLPFMDVRMLPQDADNIHRLFLEDGDVFLQKGSDFGKGGENYLRINIATPKMHLEKALNQMKKVYDTL